MVINHKIFKKPCFSKYALSVCKPHITESSNGTCDFLKVKKKIKAEIVCLVVLLVNSLGKAVGPTVPKQLT